MNWIAIVPLKAAPFRKSRLAGLPEQLRAKLATAMYDHVAARLDRCPAIGRRLTLSPDAPADGSGWIPDEGRGINAEIEAARRALGDVSLLVINADLPLLEVEDVEALIQAASLAGRAIAPDRHDRGTNALAIGAGERFRMSFGEDSFAAHLASAPGALVVRRTGVSLDIDTVDDLEMATAMDRAPAFLHDIPSPWLG